MSPGQLRCGTFFMSALSLKTAAKGGRDPIRLIVKSGDRFRTVSIDYHGGLRYPHLERTSTGEAGLDRLIAAK